MEVNRTRNVIDRNSSVAAMNFAPRFHAGTLCPERFPPSLWHNAEKCAFIYTLASYLCYRKHSNRKNLCISQQQYCTLSKYNGFKSNIQVRLALQYTMYSLMLKIFMHRNIYFFLSNWGVVLVAYYVSGLLQGINALLYI